MAKRIRASGDKPGRMAWSITNAAGRGLIEIYDVIGDWGVSASEFVRELRSLGNVPIDLRIHSEGGDAFDGIAIYNAIKNHPSEVTAHIDGLAASAASFIPMAADKIIIAPTASMMIHPAMGGVGAYGTAEEIGEAIAKAESLKAVLDSMTENIAGIYASRAGGTADDWLSKMKANGAAGSWYKGQEAVDAGLADEVAEPAAKSQTRRAAAAYTSGRIAAQLVSDAADCTIGSCLTSEVYEALTDCVEEWIESGTVTTAEAMSLTELLGPILTTLETGVAKLGLADRPCPPDDDAEMGMGGMDMRTPVRIAAQSEPQPSTLAADFSEALSAARLKTPGPSLQQLLEQHLTEPLTAAFGKGA